MKYAFLIFSYMISLSTLAAELYKGYINSENENGCIDYKEPASCFKLKMGKIIFLEEKQLSGLSGKEWIYLNKYGPKNKKWWLKSESVTLQRDLIPVSMESFPIKSYKWDGGEARMEYVFSNRSRLKVIAYNNTKEYSCDLHAIKKLMEIRCQDENLKDISTEVLKFKNGELISYKCGEWCEVEYLDGKLDTKRFQ